MYPNNLSQLANVAYLGDMQMTPFEILEEAKNHQDHPTIEWILKIISKEEKISFAKAYKLYY